MDNKKFEQLIDLIINEDEDKARELFHDIVVEKSREIYENIMDQEMSEEDDMGGQVGGLLDEINAEEIAEDDTDDMDMGDEGPIDAMGDEDEEEVIDIDSGEAGEEDEHEEIEDTVVRIEDKLDQLMAEFEEIMGSGEEADDEEMAAGDEQAAADDEEMAASDEEAADEEDLAEAKDDEDDEKHVDEDEVMEAITLKKVSVTHGDNGQNTKSIALKEPKIKTQGVNPVKFSGSSETVPTGPKAPSNSYTKGQKDVEHATSWKNAPAQASQDLEKAPTPKKGDDGSNTKSPVNEGKKIVKKAVTSAAVKKVVKK